MDDLSYKSPVCLHHSREKIHGDDRDTIIESLEKIINKLDNYKKSFELLGYMSELSLICEKNDDSILCIIQKSNLPSFFLDLFLRTTENRIKSSSSRLITQFIDIGVCFSEFFEDNSILAGFIDQSYNDFGNSQNYYITILSTIIRSPMYNEIRQTILEKYSIVKLNDSYGYISQDEILLDYLNIIDAKLWSLQNPDEAVCIIRIMKQAIKANNDDITSMVLHILTDMVQLEIFPVVEFCYGLFELVRDKLLSYNPEICVKSCIFFVNLMNKYPQKFCLPYHKIIHRVLTGFNTQKQAAEAYLLRHYAYNNPDLAIRIIGEGHFWAILSKIHDFSLKAKANLLYCLCYSIAYATETSIDLLLNQPSPDLNVFTPLILAMELGAADLAELVIISLGNICSLSCSKPERMDYIRNGFSEALPELKLFNHRIQNSNIDQQLDFLMNNFFSQITNQNPL